ncbi:MAG: tripartite tricarboxylate transporter substrate-binding protein [Rubrivivax sp.]
MPLHRRQTLALLGAAASLTGSLIAAAQPAKKLNVLVGYPAGGAPDTVARAVGEGLRRQGCTALIDNKAGAGGRLAADALLAGSADGSTVMLVPGGNLTLYPHIYAKLRYDGLRDFAPLATACELAFGVAVGPEVPARTLPEFIAWARANPGKAQFGSPGAGSAMHFIGVQLAAQANVQLQHVPYRGGAPALTDVMGGTIPAVFTTVSNLVQPHKAGKVRILAHSAAKRLPDLPDVPTFAESGFPALTIGEMFVFVALTRTPIATQKEWAERLSAAAAEPGVKAALEAADFTPLTLSQEAIAKRLAAEYEHWGAMVKATGYKAED